MKTALIAGATGLVGSFLLKELLEEEHYSKVTALVRKPLEISHPRLEQIVFDYDNPDTSVIKAEDVYCCLGTTIKKAGSKEAFRKVDYHYPLMLGQSAYENGCNQFAVVTAIGSSEKSSFFYNRVKGEVERDLKKIPFQSLWIFKPSMLLGPRKESRLGEEAAKVFMKALGFLFPKNMKGIHASQVAKAMYYHFSEQMSGIHIVESGQMQKFPVKKNLT
ncbi:MAG: oxidoreductase [Bacteroidetes bacterium]|nr:MAG: oxidoreductase [Bacteroidota bacterium]